MASEFFSLMDKIVPSVGPLPASVLGYYYGTGFIDHSIYRNNGTTFGTVPQSATPTPPAGGSGWLAGGNMANFFTDYIQFPDLLNGLTDGVIEFTLLQDSGEPNTGIIGASLGFFPTPGTNNILYIVTLGGTMYFQQIAGGSGIFGITFATPTLGVAHTVRFEFSTTIGCKVYVDSILAGSTASNWSVVSYDKFLVGPVFDSTNFPWNNCRLDGLMVSNSLTEAYPPV
jgi:hypothetical protein